MLSFSEVQKKKKKDQLQSNTQSKTTIHCTRFYVVNNSVRVYFECKIIEYDAMYVFQKIIH